MQKVLPQAKQKSNLAAAYRRIDDKEAVEEGPLSGVAPRVCLSGLKLYMPVSKALAVRSNEALDIHV